jgi:hypothetical protein
LGARSDEEGVVESVKPEDVGVLAYRDYFGPGKTWRALDVLFGLLFGGLAIFLWDDWPWLRYGFVAVGGFFFLLGLMGLLYTRGVTADRRRGQVRVWRGFLFPLWFRTYRLEQFNTVRIDRERRREGRFRTSTFYAVRLVGAGSAQDLSQKKNYLAARRRAEEAAAYLGFDLLDTTPTSAPVRIEAKHVGKPLREQLRETDPKKPAKPDDADELNLPPPPAKARCTCTADGSWLFVSIPRPRFLRLLLRPIVVTLVLALMGGVIGFGLVGYVGRYTGYWNENVPLATAITTGFALLGIIYGIFFVLLPKAFVRYQIEAHAGGLTVRRRGLIFHRTRELPAADLREVRLHPWGMEAIGTKRIVPFANNGVDGDELVWLHGAIMTALAG